MWSIDDALYIKELTEEEYQSYTAHKGDEDVIMRLCSNVVQTCSPEKLQAVKEKVDIIAERLNSVSRSFGLFDKEKYIGYVCFAEYDSNTPEIQIEISEEYRNRGIGYKALTILIKEIFSQRKDLQYFLYLVLADNIASIKLVEKLNGQRVEKGHFIEQFIKKYHIYNDDKKVAEATR